MATLYTFGYLQSRAERIISELIAVKTPIVDIRFSPTSHNYRYTQEALQSRPGILYFHIVELGNELYKDALTGQFAEPHIRLHARDEGLKRLKEILDTHKRAAIFCACSSKKTCHRIAVSELAKERFGVQVIHL